MLIFNLCVYNGSHEQKIFFFFAIVYTNVYQHLKLKFKSYLFL